MTDNKATRSWILTLSCEDAIGITHAVSGALTDLGGNIHEAQQFRDPDTLRFFMRVDGQLPASCDRQTIERQLERDCGRFRMDYGLRDADHRKRTVVFVSKFDHCLGDLLYRMRIGELAMDVRAIISNHPRLALNLTTFGDIPYHHLSVTPETKSSQEAKIGKVLSGADAELVVLARYMQILSPELVRTLAGRCVNIHHSFLPSFKGARPYHQAYKRGVKMIGATAHFVTDELDEGPIIAQDVDTVSHADEPDDLVRKGRNIEQRVLSRAVELMLADRVMLNGSKTVVFSK